MKKWLFALVSALVLAMVIPATVFASPKRSLDLTASVVAVSRTVTSLEFGEDKIETTGVAMYQGTVDASRMGKDWAKLDGSPMVAQEIYHYDLDPSCDFITTCTILSGHVTGTMTVYAKGNGSATVNFESQVFGDISALNGSASDMGTWEMSKASGWLHTLKDAKGTWAAQVVAISTPYGPTFAGQAFISGTY